MDDRTKFDVDDENEFTMDSEMDDSYRPIDLNRFNREEGHTYESIEDELDLDSKDFDDVVRELPEFDPTEDLDTELNDALGG